MEYLLSTLPFREVLEDFLKESLLEKLMGGDEGGGAVVVKGGCGGRGRGRSGREVVGLVLSEYATCGWRR